MIKQVEGVRTYFVRVDQFEWGYFFINAKGLFVAHTDFGTFGYHWPVDEEWDFLKFLAGRIDRDYLLSKISRRDVLDEDKTQKALLRDLLERRREGYISKVRARELYDGLLQPHDTNIMHWAMEQKEFYENDAYELAVYVYPVEAQAFVDRLFPVLQQQLREELSKQTEVAV